MGTFNTHGGYFAPKDYMRIDTGGSHDENPNGGVQIGMDEQGVPNLLEEGEPVYQDYVFSDNIRAEENFLSANNIPTSYKNKLFSEIADAFVDEAEERPNDPISRNGLEAMLTRLAAAQEQQKQEKQMNDFKQILSDLPPEELAEMEAQLDQGQFLAAPEQGAPVEEAPEMIVPEEQVPVMANGGLIRKFEKGGPRWDYSISRVMPRPVTLRNSVVTATSGPSFTENSSMRAMGNALFGNRALDPNLSQYRESVEEENLGPYDLPWNINVTGPDLSGYREQVAEENLNESLPTSATQTAARTMPAALSTIGRYGKAVGAGLLGLYNAFTPADKYTARRAVPYTPYGNIHLNNVRYEAVDPNTVMNEQLAQSNSTARAIQNSVNPSSTAALLALDNNTNRNLGTGLLQTIQANNQQRNAVIAANNQAEAQRAQFDFGVDAARARANQIAQHQNLQNELMLQRLNYGAEGDKYAAISNQINAGLDALAGIGAENFAMNQINSNTALEGYGMVPDGRGGFMLVPTKRTAGCGGLLKKYKK